MIELQDNPAGTRFKDALIVQDGACNPRAIARALLRAIEEVAVQLGGDTAAVREDAAVRLIAHQLAFLLNLRGLDEFSTYEQAMGYCEVEAQKFARVQQTIERLAP